MALEGLSTVKKICYGKEHMYKAIDPKVPTLVAHIVRDYKYPRKLLLSLTQFATTLLVAFLTDT